MMQGLEELLDVDPASTIEYHETLNPSIWIDEHLRGEVKIRLLEIAQAFIDFIKIPDINIVDMVVTGSNANFNYTPYSDIDLHIISDFDDLPFPKDFARDFFDTKRSAWVKNHRITIRNFNVELYIENLSEPVNAGGVFSIVDNIWIKTPSKEPVIIDSDAVRQKANDFIQRGKDILNNPNTTPAEVESLIEKIYDMRKSGLSTAGENSLENITFKALRNVELLGDLKDFLGTRMDQELSL